MAATGETMKYCFLVKQARDNTGWRTIYLIPGNQFNSMINGQHVTGGTTLINDIIFLEI